MVLISNSIVPYQLWTNDAELCGRRSQWLGSCGRTVLPSVHVTLRAAALWMTD